MTAVRAALLLLCCVPFAAAAAESIPFDYIRGRIIVEGSLNTSGGQAFIVDSALPLPVIDRRFAREQDLSVDEVNAVEMPDPQGQFVRAAPVSFDRIAIGQRTLPAREGVTIDLAPVADRIGLSVAGMVDISQLAPVAAIDFEKHAIILNPPAADSARSVPIRRAEDGGWLVNIVIDDAVAMEAAIDFGFAGVISIPQAIATNRGILTATSRVLRGIDSEARMMRVTRIRLGDASIESPIADIVPAGSRPRIGTGFFENWRTAFNFADQVLHIESNIDEVLTAPQLLGTGLSLRQCTPNGWILDVAVASPAAKAGIMPGDRLQFVDGQEVVSLHYADTDALIQRASQAPIECVVWRPAEEESFSVELEAKLLL